MSWDSKSGDLIETFDNDELFDCFMNCFNSNHGKKTSYKFCLIKSILDNIFNCSAFILSFNQLNKTFLKIYWNLICKYDLPQMSEKNRISDVEKIIFEIKKEYNLDYNCDYDFIEYKIKSRYWDEAKDIFPKYVIGALYSDLKGKIYGFDKTKKIIYFSQKTFDFLINNKCLLEKVNYYSWIVWMETILNRNDVEIGNLSLKLDLSSKRQSLNEFKKKLFFHEKETCFYCGKKIIKSSCHVDHFIPWSFVKNDNIWNLVLSCSECNLKKNNKIPNYKYLIKLIERNNKLFGDKYAAKIDILYHSALKNGFEVWKFDKGGAK